jgi:dephospho-CoA kinase
MKEQRKIVKLGITGGIGSGKTSVCRVFRVLGIPFFPADTAARSIMDNDKTMMESINVIAGKDLYPNGQLDRGELAGLIFKNRSLLEKVNSLVHPAVFRQFGEWVLKQDAPYVIMEAAILFESGASKLVDKTANIVAPEEERIRRVMLRSNLSKEQVMERIKNQMNDEERIRLSDYIIRNAENDMIIPAILEIHNDILKYIKNN